MEKREFSGNVMVDDGPCAAAGVSSSGGGIDFDAMSEKFRSKFEELRLGRKKPGILIAGATGAGKSTLCNLVFKEEIARVGAGVPVTHGVQTYENDLVRIYDSEGYETGAENQARYNELIFSFIGEQDAKGEQVHVVWYCVQACSARFTDLDAKLVLDFRKAGKPVAVVLTQIDDSTEEQCAELRRCISAELPEIEIFESTTDESIPLEKGVNELFHWTMEHLDESSLFSYVACANRDLEKKRELGRSIVLKRAGLAGLAGFSPVPVSDTVIITGIQVELMAKLCDLWNMTSMRALAEGALLPNIMSIAGKTLAGNIIKLFPVVGEIVGGMINATVASALTVAFGMAFNEACYSMAKDRAAGRQSVFETYFSADFIDVIIRMFKGYMKK